MMAKDGDDVAAVVKNSSTVCSGDSRRQHGVWLWENAQKVLFNHNVTRPPGTIQTYSHGFPLLYTFL